MLRKLVAVYFIFTQKWNMKRLLISIAELNFVLYFGRD
jgi:hypothetical protein